MDDLVILAGYTAGLPMLHHVAIWIWAKGENSFDSPLYNSLLCAGFSSILKRPILAMPTYF